MEKINTRAISVSEVFSSQCFAELSAEYRDECLRNPNLFGAKPDFEAYKTLEEIGMLKTVGVFIGAELVGVCAILISSVPHYHKRVIASTETLFVAKKNRASKAGMMLINSAESVALDAGADGLYVTAPVGGRLEKLMPHVGYHQTNSVFFRGLK